MADAVIGALRVVLGADTAALEKGLKGAQKSLSSLVVMSLKSPPASGLNASLREASPALLAG
jgi:hypothetical protein